MIEEDSVNGGKFSYVANLLWLHDMGDPLRRRASVESLETMLQRHGSDDKVLVHDARTALSVELRRVRWDAIYLGPTFLCNRYSAAKLARVERLFGWIADSKAVKVALPQDDYDCSSILETWLIEWGVDVCYSVLPEFQSVLYPIFSNYGEIRPAFTGYVDDRWVDQSSQVNMSAPRDVDVFYRAARLPANFGSLGTLKSEIADVFMESAPKLDPDLSLDISCDDRDMVAGSEWHARLAKSRFTLASPSGSSLLDPFGKYAKCVSRLKPGTSFSQVSRLCFPNMDGLYSFEAIGPRHIEAALWGTVQIAVKGNYSSVFEPNTHYIPLDRDLANLPEVIELMKDDRLVSRIQTAARDRVLDMSGLRLESLASDLIALVPNFAVAGSIIQDKSECTMSSIRLQQISDRQASGYWQRKGLNLWLKRQLKRIGAGRLRPMVHKVTDTFKNSR